MRFFSPRALILVLFLTGSLSQEGSAQVGDTLVVSSLDELLELVHLANPGLRAASLGARALGERPEQVRLLPDPNFAVGLQLVPIVTARGSQRTQWQVQQAIPFPGKLELREDAAVWTARVARAGVSTMEHSLLQQTKVAYFDLHRIVGQESLVRDFQRTLRDYETVARTRYEVGTGIQQVVLRAQLERNALSSRLIDLDRSKRTVLERLSRLTNRPLVLGDAGLAEAPALAEFRSPAELHDQAQVDRPEARALRAAAERAETMIELARMDWYPDFGLSLTYFDIADSRIPASADGRNALAVGVSVRVPLQRGRLRARLEETRLVASQVSAEREALQTSIRTEIADLLYRLEREQDQLELFTQALIPQARNTLAATLSAYTTGRIGFLDLLDAERMLFNLRWSYEASESALLKVGASLERALGLDYLPNPSP